MFKKKEKQEYVPMKVADLMSDLEKDADATERIKKHVNRAFNPSHLTGQPSPGIFSTMVSFSASPFPFNPRGGSR